MAAAAFAVVHDEVVNHLFGRGRAVSDVFTDHVLPHAVVLHAVEGRGAVADLAGLGLGVDEFAGRTGEQVGSGDGRLRGGVFERVDRLVECGDAFLSAERHPARRAEHPVCV